jgi:predicted DCC family thiol-disulfide oxidoreductase YuxK
MKNAIVLYDGVCLFCEGWVNFVIDNLADDCNVKFIPLQEVELNPDFLSKLDLDLLEGDSIICISKEGYVYLKSDASLMVMSMLKAPFSILSKALFLIPRKIRNAIYNFIGKRRLKIWGEKNTCTLPSGDRKFFFVNNEMGLKSVFIFDKYKEYFKFIG